MKQNMLSLGEARACSPSLTDKNHLMQAPLELIRECFPKSKKKVVLSERFSCCIQSWEDLATEGFPVAVITYQWDDQKFYWLPLIEHGILHIAFAKGEVLTFEKGYTAGLKSPFGEFTESGHMAASRIDGYTFWYNITYKA